MKPLHLDILSSYIDGKITREDLIQYGNKSSRLNELLLDFLIFLKHQTRGFSAEEIIFDEEITSVNSINIESDKPQIVNSSYL